MELHLGENPLSVVYMINSEAATAIVNTPLSLCLVYWANISCALLISASWRTVPLARPTFGYQTFPYCIQSAENDF
jgi:hypothetical protein